MISEDHVTLSNDAEKKKKIFGSQKFKWTRYIFPHIMCKLRVTGLQHVDCLLFYHNSLHTLVASHFSSSPRLTTVEEELMGLASGLGSQQVTVNQLELDLQNEEGSANTGQR